MTMMPMCW